MFLDVRQFRHMVGRIQGVAIIIERGLENARLLKRLFQCGHLLGGILPARRPILPDAFNKREVVQRNRVISKRHLEKEHIPRSALLSLAGDERLKEARPVRNRNSDQLGNLFRGYDCGRMGCCRAPIVSDQNA